MWEGNSYTDKQIGNYIVIAELASGSFGSVYRAQHSILTERVVAIKLLHATHLGSQQEREQFFQEAKLLEVLKHPYILPIIDVGIHGNSPYLVIEYAPGASLRDYIKKQPSHRLSVNEAVIILSQIGEALHYAHRQNIIHRDLKPENILFNSKGEALLADFGIAITYRNRQHQAV